MNNKITLPFLFLSLFLSLFVGCTQGLTSCRSSNFDSFEDQGWKITTNEGNADKGYLAGRNVWAKGAEWYFVAPPKYLGNQTAAMEIRFRLQASTLWLDYQEVGKGRGLVIEGTNTVIARPLDPSPFTFTFTPYVFSLRNPAGWVVQKKGGSTWSPATLTDLLGVLNWVECVRVQGKFSYTPHTTLLDDFQLCDGVDMEVTECPTAVANRECSGNGFCYKGSCQCQLGFGGSDCFTPTCDANTIPFTFKFGGPQTLLSYYYTWQGTVIDLPDFGSIPVEGASVGLFNTKSKFPMATALTDMNGNFVLKARAFPQYSYYLQVSKLFYRPFVIPLPLVTDPSFTASVNVTLELNQKKRKERNLSLFQLKSISSL